MEIMKIPSAKNQLFASESVLMLRYLVAGYS
jgi:hypothetical protein